MGAAQRGKSDAAGGIERVVASDRSVRENSDQLNHHHSRVGGNPVLRRSEIKNRTSAPDYNIREQALRGVTNSSEIP